MRSALANVCFRTALRLAVLGARISPPQPVPVVVVDPEVALAEYRQAAAYIAQSN